MENKQLKNICIVASGYPSKGHPVNVFVQQLAETMVDMGYYITIIAPQSLTHALLRGVSLLPKQEIYITDKGCSYKVYRPYTLSFGNGNKFLYNIAKQLNQRNINHYLRIINPQVIYGHFWGCAMQSLSYSIRYNKPIFVGCGESSDMFEKWSQKVSISQIEQIQKNISGVICVSSENLNKCLSFNLCSKKNSIVLPNCVNTDIFRPLDTSLEKKKFGIKDSDFIIVFVGGFIPRKGPDRVAKAISILNDEHIKVMFVGNEFNGYNYNFDCPGIIYKGPVSHEKLPLILNCADVFVLPTRNEGCSNAIVEALACGIPVISSNGAFNDDILDEKNSIRIDANDINALANTIAFLRDNPNIRKQMKETSLSRHYLYSLNNRAQKIVDFITQYIQK